MSPRNIAPKTGKVPTELLDFGPTNPRLIEDGIKNPNDAQIILSLSDTADLGQTDIKDGQARIFQPSPEKASVEHDFRFQLAYGCWSATRYCNLQ